MNKVFSVNIGGLVFQVDDLAYDKLKNYLDSIRKHFSGTEGKDEIISDIEARIAEMLKERLHGGKEVIAMEDVDYIIQIMGKPEEFAGEETQDNGASSSSNSSYQNNTDSSYNKRLFRDPDNKVLGGVCSGVSAYFGINDPVWMRLIFVLIFFTFGSGLLLYIILWAVIPKAKSYTDRMEMRGEQVNIYNIKKNMDEEVEDLKKNFHNFKDSMKRQHGDTGNKLLQFLQNLLQLFGKVFVKIFAWVLVVVCISGLIALVLSATGVTAMFGDFPMLISSSEHHWLTMVGILLVFGIPLLGLLIKGIKVIFNIKVRLKALGFAFLTVWIFTIIFASYTGMSVFRHFRSKEVLKRETTLPKFNSDTLLLSLNSDVADAKRIEHAGININDEDYVLSNDKDFLLRNVYLDVIESDDSLFHVEEVVSARGNNNEEAKYNANDITYTYKPNGNQLQFDAYCFFPKKNSWRNQKVRLTLQVPIGKSIHFSSNMHHFLNDVANVSDTYDENMIGHYWKMTKEGLKCTDCSSEELEHKHKRRGKHRVKVEESDTEDYSS